ncbi:MAG: nuclear transport factor 2 family protein [Polyangiaceae bacterium]
MKPRTLTHAVAAAVLLAVAGGCASTPPASTPPASTPQGETSMTTPTLGALDQKAHIQAATDVLRSYEAALNAADVGAITALYAEDGVFMAQHRSPAIGRAAVEAAYREILGMIRLHIAFEIDEVVVVSPTVAYARTRSAGTTTILANGAQVSEGNQELFILVRAEESGPFRIGRYIFSTTQPRS